MDVTGQLCCVHIEVQLSKEFLGSVLIIIELSCLKGFREEKKERKEKKRGEVEGHEGEERQSMQNNNKRYSLKGTVRV